MESKYGQIVNHFTDYVTKHNLSSIVIGISGGIDSAILAAIYSSLCKSLGVTMYGRYIHIETNSEDERLRANAIGEAFCDNYSEIDMTPVYEVLQDSIDEPLTKSETFLERKIRRGNTKARMRMIYLYNLAQMTKGMVIDTDNRTEHNLGFWTLHGDVGDYTPLIDLWKTEVYELSQYVLEHVLKTAEEKSALQACIDAVPTDGLGITSSDVVQLGCDNYNQVDSHLKKIISEAGDNYDKKVSMLDNLHTIHEDEREQFKSILNRHLKSEYKRNNPLHIKLI
ncbi:MAG: NAD(+) synthase [Bacteroidales bacterium]